MDTYEPTPTAEIIERHRALRGISVRKAAEKAKLSEGRWRQIAKGYQQAAAGVRVPVNAPAETLMRMANAVGLSSAAVRAVGDDEVADLLARREVLAARHPSRIGGYSPAYDLSDDELLAELGRRLGRPQSRTHEEGEDDDDTSPSSHAGGSPAKGSIFRLYRNLPGASEHGDVSEVDSTLAASDDEEAAREFESHEDQP